MKRLTYAISGLLIVLSITFCSLWMISAKAETKDAVRPECTYTSIKIGPGDTLDSIAEEYNTSESYSNDSYIEDVKQINNLYSDKIHPGCYLTIIKF